MVIFRLTRITAEQDKQTPQLQTSDEAMLEVKNEYVNIAISLIKFLTKQLVKLYSCIYTNLNAILKTNDFALCK